MPFRSKESNSSSMALISKISLQNSLNNDTFFAYGYFLVLMIWGDCLGRRKVIFQDLSIPPQVYDSKRLAILDHFQAQYIGPPKQRRICEENIHKTSF